MKDCLSRLLKLDMEKKNITCVLPWTKSMLKDFGNTLDNSSITNFCKENNDLWYGERFANTASQYKHSECPGFNFQPF